MKISSLLSESMLFSDFHEFKVDPDRADSYDLVDRLLPLIVKMAYKELYDDREKHEKKYGPKSDDEDSYNFEFTAEALGDKTDDLISTFTDKLKSVNSKEIQDTIKAVSKEFKEPLEEKAKK